MIRTTYFMIVLLIATIIVGTLEIIVGIFSPFTRFSRWIARLWCRTLVIAAGVHIEMEGRENFDPNSAYVIVGNHQSHMDIPVIVTSIPVHFTFVAKKELFKIPIFGWAMQAVGIIKIDRGRHEKAVAALRKSEETLRREKLSLFAFPEGTRSSDGRMRRFKKGIFILAINVGLPVLPVSITGTHAILPKKSLRIRPGKVFIKVHPPVSTVGYSFESKDELIAKVHQIIEDGIHDQAESF